MHAFVVVSFVVSGRAAYIMAARGENEKLKNSPAAVIPL